jgi:hypothetical protein
MSCVDHLGGRLEVVTADVWYYNTRHHLSRSPSQTFPGLPQADGEGWSATLFQVGRMALSSPAHQDKPQDSRLYIRPGHAADGPVGGFKIPYNMRHVCAV